MCHRLDPRFFERLTEMRPADVCVRTLASYLPEERCYELTAMGEKYRLYPERAEIRPVSDDVPPVNTELGLCIIFYLLQAKDLRVSGEWISEKDLPGGVTFFRGPHRVPGRLIAEKYGDDIEGFSARCKELQGTPASMGDAAFVFRFLPRVPVTALLWRADHEFDAEAKLLFDRTISEHLPIDVIFGLSVYLCEIIAR